METTLEEQMGSGYENLRGWTTPPKKGLSFNLVNDPLLFSTLEEAARAQAQACILSYGIRFEPSAIFELYTIIEEGVIRIKQRNDENDFEKIGEAQKNLVNLITQIATNANEQKLTTVDGKKVKEVRKLQFCPVYPFS